MNNLRQALSKTSNVKFASIVILSCSIFASTAHGEPAKVSERYSPSATCDQGRSGERFSFGGYIYSLTNQILSPDTVDEDVTRLSNGRANLVAWNELKTILKNDAVRSQFIAQLMLPLQDSNYDCGNILLKPAAENGRKNPIFFAYHGGHVLKDWKVLDEVGNHEIDVGSWPHSGRALIRTKKDQTDSAVGELAKIQSPLPDVAQSSSQIASKSDASLAKASIFVTILRLADGHTVYNGLETQSAVLCIKGIANARRTSEVRGFDSNPEYIQMEMVARKTWNTEIVAVDWQCMDFEEYNKSKDAVGEKYWFPPRNF